MRGLPRAQTAQPIIVHAPARFELAGGFCKSRGYFFRGCDAGQEQHREVGKWTRSVPGLGYSSGCSVASRLKNQ